MIMISVITVVQESCDMVPTTSGKPGKCAENHNFWEKNRKMRWNLENDNIF